MYKRQRVYAYAPARVLKRARVGGLSSGGTTGARFQNHRSARGPRSTGTLKEQVKSLQKFVRDQRPEIKYADQSIDITDIPTTGGVQHITTIAQGDTDATRTGDTINVVSIRVGGFFVRGTITLASNAQYRIAIVCDKQQVGDTAPTAGSIFQYPTEIEGAMVNVSNLERFRILHMSPVYYANMMQLSSSSSLSQTQRTGFEWSWKGNIKVSFNGSASTDMAKNNIYVVFLSNDSTGDFDGTARVGFTDV